MSTAVLPPAVPPAPPFKNRRGWIIAFGIAEILIGCLVLLLMGLAAFGMRMANVSAQQPSLDTRFMIVAAVFYGAIAAFFVAVGIGNTQVRRWARVVMLVISWAWLALGVLATAIMAFVLPMALRSAQQSSGRPMPEGFDTIFRVVMFAIVGVFFLVLPLIFLLFYSGRNVRATYESAGGVSADANALPRKPISVLIATGWFALSVLGYLFVFVKPFLPLFGVALRGWQAILVVLILEVLAVWLTFNIYRQRLLAWKVAIGMVAFGWASFLVTQVRMGLGGMYRAMGYEEAQLSQMVVMMNYVMAFSAVLAIAFVVMLIVTRKHYRDQAAG